MDSDIAIRNAAIEHCSMLTAVWGDAVPAAELTKGFAFDGQQIKLVSWVRGIFKPKQLRDGPLTLVSSLGSSYSDESLDGDVMLYDYAPESFAWGNQGLKRLSEQGRFVLMLKQVKPKPGSEYMIFAPVLVTGFDDAARKFRLDLSTTRRVGVVAQAPPNTYARRYADAITKARLHQAYFRRDTLSAYASRCCVCRLRERPLLDAAHIVSDRAEEGIANVTNGLSMCPTHHRAFDRHLLLVTAEYKIEVRRDLLTDASGEATKRFILDFDGREIDLPRDKRYRPSPELLQTKWLLACS